MAAPAKLHPHDTTFPQSELQETIRRDDMSDRGRSPSLEAACMSHLDMLMCCAATSNTVGVVPSAGQGLLATETDAAVAPQDQEFAAVRPHWLGAKLQAFNTLPRLESFEVRTSVTCGLMGMAATACFSVGKRRAAAFYELQRTEGGRATHVKACNCNHCNP